MKKLLLILSVLFVSSSVLSAADTMKMVTYFPVPYVAYSQVKVKEQMDIGTATNACRLDLGCANSALSLKVKNGINLVKGMLAFADKETTPSVTLTTTKTIIGSGAGESSFMFSNLATENIIDALSFQVTAFNPDTFYLFPDYHTGNAFPSCSSGISWKRVRLKNVDEVYLVCGDVPGQETDPVCTPTHNGLATYTENCPSGQTGNIRYIWDYTNCKYTKTNLCREESEDPDANYGYVLTSSQKMTSNQVCQTACSTVYANVGVQTSIPSSFGATDFSPNCTASNLGNTCNFNLTVSGTPYCATYTCQKL